MKKSRGSLLLETLLSLFILTLIGSSLLHLLPKILEDVRLLRIQGQLSTLADYVGNYVVRWSDFSPLAKAQSIEAYADGDELELTGENRINRLLWADPLTTTENLVTDEFKVEIKFYETVTRNNSAVIRIELWYDQNLDNVIDPDERTFSFSTVVSEKESP